MTRFTILFAKINNYIHELEEILETQDLQLDDARAFLCAETDCPCKIVGEDDKGMTFKDFLAKAEVSNLGRIYLKGRNKKKNI